MQIVTTTQTTVVPYSVVAFNALPDFQASKGRFDTKRHVLDAFGDIIRAHRVEKYLGAALIHKHFPLGQDERVVEEVGAEGSLLGARRGISEDSITPYLWHLSYASALLFHWTPVEFVVSETAPVGVQAFATDLPRRVSLLRELAAVLANNEAQDTFGLTLLHRQGIRFDRTRQILLESPGPSDRTLTVMPVSPSVSAEDDWTQTYWHFDVNAKHVTNACNGHGCAGYCSEHSGGKNR